MIQEILNSYDLHLKHLHELVSDLDDLQMVQQPLQIKNHPAWIIGHLLFSCQAIGGELGLEEWLPSEWQKRFGPGSIPVGIANEYPAKKELLGLLDDGAERLRKRLHELGDAGLAEPLPDTRYRDRFPTIGYAVVHILSGHTALHLGQLSTWRSAIGLGSSPDPADGSST